MNWISRRTAVRASAALCVVPAFFEGVAQAVYEGPGPIELGPGATHIQLVRIRRASPHGRAILHLDNLVAHAAPGVLYRVHLDRSQAVGTIAFDSRPSHRSFDVTALLPQHDRIVVSLAPQGTPAPHAVPRIGRLSLVLA